MKLKLDDKQQVVVQEGKPVYVGDDGKDIVFDAVHSVNTIARLNKESQGHRERAEAAETTVKVFEGLDPEKAREALKTVQNLNDKKLVDAGQVEQVKGEAIKATEAKYAPVIQERDSLRQQLDGAMIGGRFSQSKFIGEKLVLPGDMVQAIFGKAFKFESGKVIGYNANGEKIFSRARPGDIAEFDEALEILVDSHPHKDTILKAKSAGGSGTKASNNGNGGGDSRTITRKAFMELMPADRVAKAKEGVAVVDG